MCHCHIFRGLDLKRTFCQILTMLAVFDTIFVITATVAFSLPMISDYWNMTISPYIFPYLMPLVQISLNGSIWSVVSVAWERFISIVYPSSMFSNLTASHYIIPVILFSCFWNIPRLDLPSISIIFLLSAVNQV